MIERRTLRRWYAKNARDLPWRRTRDPYAIWVSEIMLQQTQVATVIPYWKRFLEPFPDAVTLASAAEQQVLAAWSGLGYYRRARAMHRAAQEIVERFDGELPQTVEELQTLPGIGRYTAGAIASIAFGTRAGVLDGNVRRVLARLTATDAGSPAQLDRKLWPLADAFADSKDPGTTNQALMELGATVCHATSPDCPACPWRKRCAALAEGAIEKYPVAAKRPPTVAVRAAAAVVRRKGKLLLERRADDNPLRGTWELPAVELADGEDARFALRERLAARYGIDVAFAEARGSVRHGILQRRLTVDVLPGHLRRGRTTRTNSLRWVAPEALAEVAISGATRKILAAASD